MLIYLASPYTPKNKDGCAYDEYDKAEIRHERFVEVCRAAAILMDSGYKVFCPIAHSHPIEVHGMDKIHSGDFWLEQDFAVLKYCQQLFVCTMDGWKESHGVQEEIKYAHQNGIPVVLLDMDALLNCRIITQIKGSLAQR